MTSAGRRCADSSVLRMMVVSPVPKEPHAFQRLCSGTFPPQGQSSLLTPHTDCFCPGDSAILTAGVHLALAACSRSAVTLSSVPVLVGHAYVFCGEVSVRLLCSFELDFVVQFRSSFSVSESAPIRSKSHSHFLRSLGAGSPDRGRCSLTSPACLFWFCGRRIQRLCSL